MEYFLTRMPVSLSTLVGAGLVDAHNDEPVLGVSLIGGRRKGILTFCDRLPAPSKPDPGSLSIILVPRDLHDEVACRFPSARLVVVRDPRATFVDVLRRWQQENFLGLSSDLPDSPQVSTDAVLSEGVLIEAGVQVDPGARIGSGTVLRRGSWVRAGATVGENCVIGAEGINAYRGEDGLRRRFPHVASAIIGEGASVGSSCVVVRGILTSTRIGSGSIVGNLCNVGHGVELGSNVWMSAGTIVGGHAWVGDDATVGLGCAIRDNVHIGAGASIGMGSVVTKDIRDRCSVFGNPARVLPSAIEAGPTR
jgi:UDP-3-O-[3-hydroxymyristoyl] glucosamine N-acyltransferase